VVVAATHTYILMSSHHIEYFLVASIPIAFDDLLVSSLLLSVAIIRSLQLRLRIFLVFARGSKSLISLVLLWFIPFRRVSALQVPLGILFFGVILFPVDYIKKKATHRANVVRCSIVILFPDDYIKKDDA